MKKLTIELYHQQTTESVWYNYREQLSQTGVLK